MFQSSYGQENAPVFGRSEVSISSAGQPQKFNVEIADKDILRAQGLMFRQEMPEKSGMLFLFDSKQMVIMWMKDTYIPLDIIFIDHMGNIVHIAKSTVPESLDHISSQVPVVAALEVNAGVTDKLHIQVGDKIDHPFFSK